MSLRLENPFQIKNTSTHAIVEGNSCYNNLYSIHKTENMRTILRNTTDKYKICKKFVYCLKANEEVE